MGTPPDCLRCHKPHVWKAPVECVHPARRSRGSASRAAAARVTLAAALTAAAFAGCSVFSVENDDLDQLRSQQ